MDAFITDHLQRVSRTYAILIPLLPRELGAPVGLAYLLLRIVDTIEDAPALSDGQRGELLARLESALVDPSPAAADLLPAIGETADEQALLRDAAQVLTRLGALDPPYRDAARNCARHMMAGVREFAARSAARGQPYPAIRTADELRRYCYFVAGVVGEMLCAMMAHYLRRPALLELRGVAVELGIGLQLVNILKDAARDARHGRRYLPTPADAEISHAEVYKAVLEEARQSLLRGTEFVLALPAQAAALRSFCGLPIAWGALTLARARRDAGRAKITRAVIRASLQRFTELAGDNQSLRRWFARLLRVPATA